jgi:SPX domain protein involved in polyphosphate accumulation
MFTERSERVYFLARERVDEFVDSVGEHLGLHEFEPSASGVYDPAAHYVTTLYFDSPLHDIAIACEAGGDNVRLRTREYHDRRGAKIRHEPLVWVELKARSGDRTRKRRFALALDEAGSLLEEGVISPRLGIFQRAQPSHSATLLAEIAELGTRTRGPLGPDCVVRYRRRAWQDSDERIRITLDTELSYHRPPARPFVDGRPLVERLGPACARLPQALVEIKLRQTAPAWLDELTEPLALAFAGKHTFSKFVAASLAVHGSLPSPR